MRFVKVAVESFQAIQRAEVEFGPSLNVLYGANDLGKSTLGAAIRAALLVPPTSSEATQFASWYADATPRVSLTFVDDDGHFWKVSKGFGDGAHTGSELLHSKDGASFVLDCKARQVEEKIRGLLGWGIPAPGGKSGPRGIPSTFLANALLASQTDVDAILEASLANDPEPSGKLRLSKALATLAQDPLFKKVLDAAQREADQCFTRTGQRSRAQTSRFAEAAAVIKGLQKERDVLQRQVVESSAIEESVGALRERRARALMRVAEATRTLSTLRESLARARARDEAQARLDAARIALEEIDAFASRVGAIDADIEALSGQVNARQTELASAIAECDAAAAEVVRADEAHRRATSEDGVRERELRRAQLAEQAAALSATRQAAESRKARVDAALQARADALAARDVAVGGRTDLEKLSREVNDSRGRATAVEKELELAHATLAYGRWRAASSSVEAAARARDSAGAARLEAERKGVEGKSLEVEASAAEEKLAKRQAMLPTADVATGLEQIERELEIAEAALGGGLSVVVRPRAAVQLRAVVDQGDPVNEGSLTTERVIDAERTVRLTVGDLVDIEVTAGAADKRRAVESLRTRASTEIFPLLQRAGLQSVRDVRRELEALARERASAVELRKRAAQLQLDAKALRDRAVVQEEQAATLDVSADDLEARRAAIGATDLRSLESSLVKLGKTWEAQAEAVHLRKTNEFKAAQVAVTTTEQAAKLKEYRVSDAEARAAEAAATAEASLAALQSPVPDALLHAIESELTSLARSEGDVAAALASLGAEASGQVESAKKACDAARKRTQSAKDISARAAMALEEVKGRLNARMGERGALRAQLDALDRVGAAATVEARERELAALPVEPAVTDAQVSTAERQVSDANRELDEAKEELHKSEGALSKVGGAAIKEEVERVQEALTLATVREKALEVDADAWKLLRDTLRDVENEEGAHLGRALAGPVATRFVELTGGRYRDLRLDATLRTEAVAVAAASTGGSEVLSALSVGTRGQLATLIRLAVAEQLKSAIILDDHLVHTDPKRLAWFRDVLTRTALNTQVIALTCRAEDYLSTAELADGGPMRDVAGGTLRAIDAARVLKRYAVGASRPPTAEAAVPPTVGG